jgi:alpha-1,6-mannosyltransferase
MVLLHRLCLCMSLLGVLGGFYLGQLQPNAGISNTADMGWLTVAQFSFLSVCMLLAWWSAPNATSLRDVRLLLFVAVLARLICIPMETYTSNDMDRYLFDGKIALSGYDPYQVNHNDESLTELKNLWHPPEEHAQYPTLYPPLSLGLFTLVATTGLEQAPLTWKALTSGFGILTVFILALLLERMGYLKHLSIAALSPLLIMETGIGAHIDTFSTFFVAVALYLYNAKRLALTGMFIGLGALTKILPIILILPLCLGQKKLRASINIGAAAIITVALGYGITYLLGFVPIGSIGTLFEKWRFGSPLFSILDTFFTGQLLAVIPALGLFSGLLYIAYQSWKLSCPIAITDPLIPLSMALVLLVSPVVFPWYLMVLMPLLVVAPRPFLLTWACTLPLSYEVLGGFYSAQEWAPATWPLVVIFSGFVGALVFEYRSNANRQRAGENIFDPSYICEK